MKHLYAPWRKKYFEEKEDGCVFCQAPKSKSAQIIWRGEHCYLVMNKYPYTLGHFLVIPYAHECFLEDIDEETWQEMSKYAKLGEKILRKYLHAGGVNLGMNLGSAAGAGIAPHLHYHVLPRWSGDTNFITTIAGARVLGSVEDEIFARLKEAFNLELE